MTAAALKACIECGDLAEGTRCKDCQAERDQRLNQRRGGAHVRGYTRQWQRTAAKVKRRQPACAVCGATTDLTVDHVVPKAAGGTDDEDNLQTLCRSHNGAKGARR